VFDAIRIHGRDVKAAIRTAASRHGLPLIISGTPSVFSVHWGMKAPPHNYRETLRSDAVTRQRFQLAMLERGVYLLPDGRWYVGATHDATALAKVRSAIDASVAELAVAPPQFADSTR
jgi:glutamate-1-semialdehyde aminotransferase